MVVKKDSGRSIAIKRRNPMFRVHASRKEQVDVC